MSASTPARGAENEWLSLAQSGAPNLAITLIDEEQGDLSLGSREWVRLEGARLAVLEYGRRWETLLASISHYPSRLPEGFMLGVNTLKAKALLGLNQALAARRVLRRLVWTTAPQLAKPWYARWQQLIIKSYLSDRLLGDAATALLEYKQHYGKVGRAYHILQARTLLAAGQSEGVESILTSEKGPEVEALRLLSQLHSKQGNLSGIWSHAQVLAQREGLSDPDRRRFWVIAGWAALQAGHWLKHVASLEQAWSIDWSFSRHDPLFAADADELWDAYLGAGRVLGEKLQLAAEDDSSWLEAALSYDEHDPVKARSIYGVLALQGSSPRYQELAHRRLAGSLRNQEFGAAIIDALYTQSKRFEGLDRIPSSVRASLADYHLERDNIDLAAKLVMGVKQVPEGYDTVSWQLLLSRVAILSGRNGVALKRLKELLSRPVTLEHGQAESLIRGLLDLQRVGEYQNSIELYDKLLPLLTDHQQRRQVWYWQAEAYRLLKRPAAAARLYLQSAGISDQRITDAWGLYTRFHAAEVLSEAGLVEDARRIYRQLLSDTETPGRRAVILHKLRLLPLNQ
ncbi:MAG: hypothetical protein GY807_14115 [Gammaproteobacteria bacterium]|nr:hypothetical protein [Gammaproteobacteria bacterium]